jgi:hypothetical protein
MADLLAVSSVMASQYLGENLNNARIKWRTDEFIDQFKYAIPQASSLT